MAIYCKQCGKKLKEGALFCTDCGTKVISLESEKPQNFAPMDRISLKQSAAHRNRNLLIIVFSIVGVIVIAAAVYFIVGSGKGSQQERAQTVSTTSKNTAPQKKETNKKKTSTNSEQTILNSYTKQLEALQIHAPGQDISVGSWKILEQGGKLFLEANKIPSKDLARIFDLYDASNLAPLQEWAKNVYYIAEDLSTNLNKEWSIDVGNSCVGEYPMTLSSADLSEYDGTCGYSVPVLTGENKDNLSLVINSSVFDTSTTAPPLDTASGDYILPGSDYRKLTESDIEGLTPDQLRLARNEIYARHGYIFQSADLNAYFSQKSWYYPDSSFDGNTLSEVEKYNVDLIQSREKELP